jgi:hypothetical protein
MIGCRPSVVDSRAKEVPHTIPYVALQFDNSIYLQFLTKIKVEHGYKSIGVVGFA